MIALAAAVLLLFGGAAQAQPTPSMIARFDAGGLDLGEGVAVGVDGRVAVTGVGEVSSQKDFVTVLFDSSGTPVWSRRIDEGDEDRGGGVAIDAAGSVYAAGTVRGAGDDVLLVKYSPSGNETWSLRFDKGTSETARAVALDPAGNVVVAGSSFSANGGDGFVAKFSPDGQELWSRPVNLFWLDEFFAVDSDPQGNILAAGRVASEGNFNVIVRKFSPAGETLWTQYINGDGNEEGRGVAADAEGNVYVSGTASVPAGTEVSTDILVAKFSPAGDLAWKKTFDLDGGPDEGRAAVTDSGGNVLVTGFGRVNGNKDPFVLKIGADGSRIWVQATPGAGIDGAGSIATTPDGSLVVVAGATQREGADFDYLVIGYDQGRPSAAFSFAPERAPANANVTFEDASVPEHVPIVARLWSFGDGATSTDLNPLHQYAQAGAYLVRLTVRDAWGNADTAQREFRVLGPTLPGAPEEPTTSESGEPDETTEPGEEPEEPDDGIPGPGLLVLLVGALGAIALLRRSRRSQ